MVRTTTPHHTEAMHIGSLLQDSASMYYTVFPALSAALAENAALKARVEAMEGVLRESANPRDEDPFHVSAHTLARRALDAGKSTPAPAATGGKGSDAVVVRFEDVPQGAFFSPQIKPHRRLMKCKGDMILTEGCDVLAPFRPDVACIMESRNTTLRSTPAEEGGKGSGKEERVDVAAQVSDAEDRELLARMTPSKESEIDTAIRVVARINYGAAYGHDPKLCAATSETLKALRSTPSPCPDCRGKGIINGHYRCDRCKGTGRVKA